MNLVFRKFNSFIYYYHLYRIRLGIRIVKEDSRKIIPVFLLGTQGGGLTLVARILHRCPSSFYVCGNNKYWAGSDEMQNVLSGQLPKELTWRKISNKRKTEQGWLYATGNYIEEYRDNGLKIDQQVKKKTQSILKKLAILNAPKKANPPLFFIDKSQLYTLKAGFISRLLSDWGPKFILVTRNPYAICWRAVIKGYKNMINLSNKEKLRLAVEHWKNSFSSAIEDGYNNGVNMKIVRFEDVLERPEYEIENICKFIGLRFDKKILPQKNDKIPIGSAFDVYTHKWFPLRTNLNKIYLQNIPDWAIKMISEECSGLIKRFHYSPDGP